MVRTIDNMSDAEGPVLRAMFEARKRVFVDLLKWNVPVLAGTWEIDRFDDPEASYIVVTDGRDGHRASARLLKTTGPHILTDLYADLVEGEVPRGQDVLEITRFCLDRSLVAWDRRRARDRLLHALVDHALARNITRFTGVAHLAWFNQIKDFGWRCDSLGAPQMIGGSALIALSIEIDAKTPSLLSGRGIGAACASSPCSGLETELSA